MKHKSKINFIIDVLMFIVMMAIGGIGFLIKFILVPGSQRWEIYGDNVDLFLWGWDRHQWGSVHLVLGYILLGLLVLHIVFHWSQIKRMFRSLISQKSMRIVLTFLFVIVSVLLFLFAFVVNFDVIDQKSAEGSHRIEHARPANKALSMKSSENTISDVSSKGMHYNHEHRISQEKTGEVYGRMTLKEVEKAYGVPADSVKKILDIPANVSDYENLGRLRKKYGFHMGDVELLIEKYRRMNR